MDKRCIIIPAVKKNVAFADDLVKNLVGISLIQRAIDKSKAIVPLKNIYVVTDSEEIRLICQRNRVCFYYNKALKLEERDLFTNIKFFTLRIAKKYKDIIILSPYAPLLEAEEVTAAYNRHKKEESDLLLPVKSGYHRIFQLASRRNLRQIVFEQPGDEAFLESRAFQIFRSSLVIEDKSANDIKLIPYELSHDLLEIKTYQDWWVCEKLLNRKKIVFRVVGNETVGMGHIYRALSLAHEITDHEIKFVCDEKSRIAASKLAGYDYWLDTYKEDEIEEAVVALKPDLVINDTLNTEREYIEKLKSTGIKVLNFEDLGGGASFADVTINELYDDPVIPGDNILWGHGYFFLRNEFSLAVPHVFEESVSGLLITFGGTDQNDFTRKTFNAVLPFCAEKNIRIYLVTGEGYGFKNELRRDIKESGYSRVVFTHATGAMSGIMEKTQLAVTSNGRTLFELAHMNIPAIVLSHHPRENTHPFADKKHGFINLGLYENGKTETLIIKELTRLVLDNSFRRTLYKRTTAFNFSGENKKRVVDRILELLSE